MQKYQTIKQYECSVFSKTESEKLKLSEKLSISFVRLDIISPHLQLLLPTESRWTGLIHTYIWYYRSGFLKKDRNHFPNSHLQIWRPYGLGTVVLLGVISDICRVLCVVQTLWMTEMTSSKASFLKPFVLQILWCEFREWFGSFLRKYDLYLFVSLMEICRLMHIIFRG